MAETTIKFLSYAGLEQYHGLITGYVNEAAKNSVATSFKGVSLTADGKLQFWTVLPFEGVENLEPAYEITLPKEDLTPFMKLVEGAVEGNVASFGADGQVIDSEIKLADLATKAEVKEVADALTAYKTANDVAVQKAQGDVDDLKEFVGTLPEGAEATTVVEYINKKTEGIATDTALAELQAAVDAIEEDYLTSDDEIFETDILTVNALGGIKAGEDLNGKTTHEILNKLLFPYVAQEVGTPTRTPSSTVLEKGNDQTITAVSVKVTKKSEAITSVALYKGDELLAEKTGDEVAAGGTFTFSDLTVSVPSTSVVLTVKVTDASGNVVSKSTAAWNFVYPYYIGVCAEDATIDEALVEGLTKKVEAKGNKSNTFTCDYQRMVFAYPKAHGVLKSILDPNNFEIIGSFDRNEVNITGLDGTAQTYYVYVNGASTVTDFVVNFKY